MPSCYLLHFVDADGYTARYKHAAHYLGTAEVLSRRLDEHARGRGARLTEVVRGAGLSWILARTWDGGRATERRLKRYHDGCALCPICREEQRRLRDGNKRRCKARTHLRAARRGQGRPVRFRFTF